ncbi:PREDICTED: G-type lectin S-receptor-like serine/threonine-protein kinase CES101 [Populus euphratica]|uniref:G-type lectin S-receptor-like serine/threonine-protein kinase CES101 n=1 Tax=Populus euphratica TaxID=75702 RepID=A0AAJ6V051_POPEU|nr:PREDICTED: G-type lectin S-receptor-like serine/threonine-protein kinase CES101 [Populus euphratica]
MACAIFILLVTIFSFLSSNYVAYAQNDTLKRGQQLRDYEQLISAGGVFRLGFFSPNPNVGLIGTAGARYLGIWFEQIPFYSVWVANRDIPVPDSSGVLTIGGDGKLKITYRGGPPIVINSNVESAKNLSGNITATLLDSGNLVVRKVDCDGTPGTVLWQSFDYPHNILLPGMKLGMNHKTGKNWTLTSWLSEKVPAPGAFRLGLDPSGANQLLVWRRDEVYWSSGVWQNGSFQSAPELTQLTKGYNIYDFKFVANEEETYFSYSIKERSILSRLDLDTLGEVTLLTVDRRDGNSRWIFETSGACHYGFKNSTSVCLTEKPTKCRNGTQSFVPKRGYINVSEIWYDTDTNLSLSDCHARCWKNCTCSAYQALSPSDGIGCHFWSNASSFIPRDDFEFVYLLTNESNEEGIPV